MDNSVQQDLPERVRRLERRLDVVEKRDPGNDHNLRDHIDGETWYAADGHNATYDAETGLWKPVIAPASWKWHWRLPVVEEGDTDDVLEDCKLFAWSIRLKTAGSSTTTVTINSVADGLIETLTLASSATRNSERLAYALAAGDGLFAEVTGVGTGAEGLTVAAWAKPV